MYSGILRKRVEEMFTDKIMTTNYLSIFEKY
jgi:hypothetical protein